MNQNKRILSLALISALALSLAAPAAGFAAPKKFMNQDEITQQGPPAKVLQKILEVKQGKIKTNGNVIKFDAAPLNKGGRILIPIRALENGLGCKVDYNDEDKNNVTVTISRLGSSKVITIYLNATDINKTIKIGSDYVTDLGETVGLHNNRTYVPLRFIAETFELDVKYDEKTGDVDVKDGPRLDTKEIVFKTLNDITKDVDVKLLNLGENYDFLGITGLSSTNYSEKDGVVTLDEQYLEGLKSENNKLVFRFEDENDKVIERTLSIILEYNKIAVLPVLDPVSKTFSGADIDITLPANYTLVSISKGSTILDNNNQYTVKDGKVTLDDNYLKTLTTTTELKIILKDKDNKTVEVSFTVKI